MDNKHLFHIKKIYQLIQMVIKNKHPESLDFINNDNISLLYSFPGYVFKRNNINLNSLIHATKIKSFKKSHLIEDFSQYEINILTNFNINTNNTILPIETGMNLYGDIINNQNYYNLEYESCHIAGISGHYILHFTLGIIFNIDFRFILLGQMLEMTPIHHSMT